MAYILILSGQMPKYKCCLKNQARIFTTKCLLNQSIREVLSNFNPIQLNFVKTIKYWIRSL